MALNLEGYIKKHTTIKLGGKDFIFSEVTLGEFAQFRARLTGKREADIHKRRKSIMEQAEAIGGIDPEKILDKLQQPMTDDEVDFQAGTIEGIGYLAYLSLKNSLPEVSLPEVMGIISVTDIPKLAGALFPVEKEAKKKQTKATTKKRK